MKKFALLSLSILVLIIGVGLASATDINGTVDDASHQAVDHQFGVDEISHSNDENPIPATPEIVKNNSTDGSDTPIVKEVDDLKSNVASPVTDNPNQSAPNLFDDAPKKIDTSVEKQDSLKKDIAKYNKFFQKNHYKTMANGKKFSQMDLILEIYKYYSFEDTVIIATHVLRDNGVRVTFTGVEGMLCHMLDGTVYTQKYEMNASYYKDAMGKIQESHKLLSSEVKKYSDLFNKKNGKSIAYLHDLDYCYIDLILEVYRNHSNVEEAILISTYALKNSGYNMSVVSVEDTFNQIVQRTIKPDNHPLMGLYYHSLYFMLKTAHDSGSRNDLFDKFDEMMQVNA